MRILVSGASIAGPVLAYWLTRHGFDVTVVERAPTLRKTGGHAVDLFRPAMEISAKMGVLPRIEALTTGTDRLTMYREGRPRPTEVDLTKIYGAASDRHVEIMRDDLSEIYYDAAARRRRVPVRRLDHGDRPRRRGDIRACRCAQVRRHRRRRRAALECPAPDFR